jgi:hypothetical protein
MIRNFETSTLKYKNAKDMQEKLSQIIEDMSKIDDMKKSACKKSDYFSLGFLQRYFTEEILNKINEI